MGYVNIIEKILYSEFLELPEDDRRSCSIAHEWQDEQGAKWVAVFLWADIQRLHETMPDNLYLEFYNLDSDDADACLEFISKYHITYVKDAVFDNSGAFKYTISNLQAHHSDYQTDFHALLPGANTFCAELEKYINKTRTADGQKGGWGVTVFRIWCRINEHLERCHPVLKFGENQKNRYYYKHLECKDFLSLCYFQLIDAVINQDNHFKHCAECNAIFLRTRPNKNYCSVTCRKRANNRKQMAALKANAERYEQYKKQKHEYMRKYRKL